MTVRSDWSRSFQDVLAGWGLALGPGDEPCHFQTSYEEGPR